METVTVNIPSQIVIQTAAEWAADSDVYGQHNILVTSDVYYTGTDQRKFKLANGIDDWSGLDYMPLGGGTAVQSVTGDGVDNTDPLNPILSFPTSSEIGLGNVDNTSDANKPISSATQTALNNKEPLKGSDDNYVTDAQLVVIGNTSGTNTGNETAATIGAIVNGAASATPNDTDLVVSVESSVVKKSTWAQIKTFLATYFSTLYVSLTGGYANPSWITSLAWSKITGTPTTIAGYGITDSYPLWEYYSDGSQVSPADNSIYYSSYLNNAVATTSNTVRFLSTKTNTSFLVSVNIMVSTTLGSNETSTVKLLNITAGTEEIIGTIGHDRRLNIVGKKTTLANSVTDELIVQINNPAFGTNPTGVFYSFKVKAY